MKVNVYDVIADPEPKLLVLKTIDIEKDILKSYDGMVKTLNKHVYFDKLISEQVYCIGFSNNMEPTGIFFVSSGQGNMAEVDIRKLGIELLLSNSMQFVMFHNHPSGDRKVSENDVTTTCTYMNMAQILNLRFLTHIMITKNYYVEAIGGNCDEWKD